MKKTLLSILIGIISFVAKAQVIDGNPWDSTMVKFSYGTMMNYIPDTSTAPLWQIGHSHKTFFNIDTLGTTRIMTDSLNVYPVSADNWFMIKIHRRTNTIIDFWHSYQTDSGHDGGIVEFSVDSCKTWQNVKGGCNMDSSGGLGTHTYNFYTFNDTLATGIPAFTGTNTGRFSRLQFFEGLPVKSTTGGGCLFYSVDTFYVRFRFISDTVADSLAGWVIDSIKIETDDYGSSVAKVPYSKALDVSPNPSRNGNFLFPSLKNEESYTIEAVNTLGQTILKIPYNEVVNLSGFSRGLYFYKVTDGTEYYSGRLLYE